MAENNTIKNRSNDAGYFIMTPRVAFYVAADPFQFALCSAIRDIAGESGECFISTEDLATLSMMSTGKVSQCRKALMEKGLIEGEFKRDPGYPQPVWHLSIPDLWPRNTRWCLNKTSILSRLEWRREQKEPSCSEGLEMEEPSPHEGGVSPHEGGVSPHEEGVSPHETKNIIKKNKKESKEDVAQNTEKHVEIWRSIEAQLKLQLNSQIYRQYVEGAEPVSFDGSILNVKAPDYKATYMNSRLASTINKLLQPIAQNANAEVQFLPVPSLPAYG